VAEEALRGGSMKAPTQERSRPRAHLRAFRRDERGQALVEFALVAPILLLLIIGILDFGRALDYYNQITQLAGQGARAAAVNRNPDGTAITSGSSLQSQLVSQYTAQPELKKGISVCITQLPTQVGDPVTVKVSYKFNFIPLIGKAVGALGGLTLSSTETERAEAVPPAYAAVNQSGQSC
jgi:Flp pilus assembly protein TadG